MARSLSSALGMGTLWTSGSSILLKFVNLATIFLTLRYLSVYEYGVVGLVVSLISLFGISMLPGIDDMIINDMGVAKSRGDSAHMKLLFFNYFKLRMVFAVVTWAVIFFGSELISSYYGSNINILIKIISFTFLISPIFSVVDILFKVDLKFIESSVFSVAQEVVKLAIIAIGFSISTETIRTVIIATVFSQLIAMIFMIPSFWTSLRKFYFAHVTEQVSFWHLLRFHGKWSLASNYLNAFAQNIRLWLIKLLIGTEAVGLFSVAQGLVSNTISLLPISSVVAPALPQYMDDRPRFYRILHKSIKYQVLGFIILAFVAMVLFPPIIVWLFPNYAQSMPLFRIMILALIPMGFGTVTAVYFALKKQHMLSALLVGKLMLTIILLPPLIWKFGLYGIAVEYVVTVALFVWVRHKILYSLLPGYKGSLRNMFRYDSYDKEIIAKIRGAVLSKLGLNSVTSDSPKTD